MKKLITLLLLATSFVFIGSSSSTAAANAAVVNTPQVRVEIGPQRRRSVWARGERVGYSRRYTRVVRRGWRTYRETYRVRYFPNGATRTVLVSRVRLY